MRGVVASRRVTEKNGVSWSLPVEVSARMLKSSKPPSVSSRSVVESGKLLSFGDGWFSWFPDVMQSTPLIKLLAATGE